MFNSQWPAGRPERGLCAHPGLGRLAGELQRAGLLGSQSHTAFHLPCLSGGPKERNGEGVLQFLPFISLPLVCSPPPQMDADYDPTQQPVSLKKKWKVEIPLLGKKKCQSWFAKALQKEKKPFDPGKPVGL